MASRKDQKEQARAARVETEQKEEAAKKRKQRIALVIGVVVVAVVVIVAAIAISQSGSSDSGDTKATKDEGATITKRFAGIPQDNTQIGDKKAPVTLIEFGDLQCPVCKQFSDDAIPTLIKDYVKPGKLQMDFRFQTFVAEQVNNDSERAARFALAVGFQNKMWQFNDLFYTNQGQEGSGYVTDQFLRDTAEQIPGLDVDQAFKERDSTKIDEELVAASQEFQDNGFSGTPSFLIGKTGSKLEKFEYSALTADEFTAKIDELLK